MRSLAVLVLFAAACSAKEPVVQPLTQVGATPPAITLTTTTGTKVALAELTSKHDQNIVVFYRGFF